MSKSGFIEMPQYRSHKKVWALKISKVEDCGTDTTTDENPVVLVHFVDSKFPPTKFNLRGKPTPEFGWYMVMYEDGYISFSPADVFEQGHTLITGDPVKDIIRQASPTSYSDDHVG